MPEDMAYSLSARIISGVFSLQERARIFYAAFTETPKVEPAPAEDRDVTRKQSDPIVRRCISNNDAQIINRKACKKIVNRQSSIQNQLGKDPQNYSNSNMEV
jgi:hypothetical protein